MPLWVLFDLFMASRFWESSLGTEETEEQRRRTVQENNREEEHAENTAKPTSGTPLPNIHVNRINSLVGKSWK